jgi:fatty-acyl-CoA synthase
MLRAMSRPQISYAALLHRRAERTPKRRALTFEGTTWTYEELARQSQALAGQLAGAGIGPGDRVAYLGFNHPSYLLTLYACSQLGAIFVPLNFRLTGPELTFIVNDAGARVLIADDDHRAVIDSVRDDLEVETYLSAETEAPGWPPIDVAAEPLHETAETAEDDVAIVMYTSGTTGLPKGAMLTNGNLWWNNQGQGHTWDVQRDDVTLAVMPLFHIGGLNALTMITLEYGGHVVLHRNFDARKALADIATYRVTTMMGVPAIYQAMVDDAAFETTDKSTLRMFICGGAPCPIPLLLRYQQLGVTIHQGYGLTECAPSVCFLAPEYAESHVGSCGVPYYFTEVRLIDEDGREITGPRVNGELCAKGPNVMKGYWNREEATAEVLGADGWLRTGDIAYYDEDGFIYIADRVKDMIISGGENVYPAEVESVLSGHPAVAEVAVVGAPHERWGETPVAVAALRPGSELTIEQLRDFATASLARYKLPTRLEVVDALPRNATGKVVKPELRERFGTEVAR